MSRTTTVAGLDLSLTGAGIAVIRSDEWVDMGFPRQNTHLVTSNATDDSLKSRARRFDKMVQEIVEQVPLEADLICIEDMPYGATGRGTVDRTWLWGSVVSTLVGMGIPMLQVNVSTVKIYATGRGNKVGKDEVMLALARRYPDAPITDNNTADAWCLAAIAARLVGEPIETSLPQTHLRAVDKLVVPS